MLLKHGAIDEGSDSEDESDSGQDEDSEEQDDEPDGSHLGCYLFTPLSNLAQFPVSTNHSKDMSEYAKSGFQGSLVDKSQDIRGLPKEARDAAMGNYASEGDTTSSGGYGSPEDSFSGSSERPGGKSLPFMPAAGLLGAQNSQNASMQNSRSASMENLVGRAGNTAQGNNADTRRDGQGSAGGREYGDSWDSKEEAARRLSAGITGNKGRHF
ncbi:hypothetical protein FIBSPDRAFT_1054475 [Athelia psychrophila]|uniref:Uncharacterized protein n=1 Tax=Athelia psychrophila TaxID=1759441 RepID=A0A167V923_9AGAM|nr:hypothetical protein FIBSPDRAFT_1054475 [Fibularhizoctonia sp. CBS 109695]